MNPKIHRQTNPARAASPQGQFSTPVIPDHSLGRWLKTLAVGGLLLGASLVQAGVVTFGDGLTHSISDATYRDQRIIVANGTTLIIESGAVLGGSSDAAGQVDAYDTSTVIVRPGAILGGAGSYSGAVIAHGAATVTITGGTFGSSGWLSGAVIAYDASMVTIEEGTFRFTGIPFVYDSSTVIIRASNFDTTFFDPTFGGLLGVTFCSGTEQSFPVYPGFPFFGTIMLALCADDVPIDTDGDGVEDEQDACPSSDLRSTVWIGDCDSGVPNDLSGAVADENGCSLADGIIGQLSTAATDVRNHGQFVRAMAHYLNTLADSGLITTDEHGALMHCIGSADHRQFSP